MVYSGLNLRHDPLLHISALITNFQRFPPGNIHNEVLTAVISLLGFQSGTGRDKLYDIPILREGGWGSNREAAKHDAVVTCK
jgi:hypothetical protein